MKIVVTTPTGNVGSHVVPLLVQAGALPTVLVRDSAKLSDHVRKSCDVVEVDQGDVDGVIRATAGADALFWVDPPTDDDDPIAGHARMGESAARAVRENGIGRVVFQSSGGAEARHGFGEIDGLARTEELLDDTPASVTHLRCGYFFTNLLMDIDGLRNGVLTTTLPIEQRIPWVAPRDIAAVAAARLLSEGWHGRVSQGVYGPVDLSFAEVAEIVGNAIGRNVVADQITDEQAAEPLRGFGLSEAQVEAIVGMSRGLRGGYVPESPRDITSTTPTTLGSWAYETLRPVISG
ncbi:NAD(P)H-binding protein [Saxibacter everestensis]|uniref:NAD(P)H-binding protein n=1 Tax=Saxibacter everestensis TaxID=2909229 RepID=A0ABY8QRE0_9MICO|nr:NAD(P)H-binding protein [Brevibacteriaceae bacterium ZFBP1038]